MTPYRRSGQIALYALAMGASLLPVLLTVFMAYQQSKQNQLAHAMEIADGVLRRTERVSDQLATAFARLREADLRAPCAPEALDLMRSLVLESNLLTDVGYIEGDMLRCSAFGQVPYPVGPVSYTSTSGYKIRTGVQHPLAPKTRLVITTEPGNGFSGLAHESASVEALPAIDGLSAGLIGLGREQPMVARGEFKLEWLSQVGTADQVSFFDGTRIVAWKRSKNYAYAAYATLPRSALDAEWQHSLLLLLPLGGAAGLLLAWVLARLARQRTSMAAVLRQGLARGELFLMYQPVVELATGRWVGVEALVRWRRPDGSLVPPDIFIPIAEQNQLIGHVTEEVIRIVEREVPALLQRYPDFHVAINLAADDFCNPAMPERLQQAVQRLGGKAANLQVEATERIFLHVEATRKALADLQVAGIVVAIDDFGTGYSSLSYLTGLSMDLLKIDKSFVDTIGTEAVTSRVVGHIIEMAKSLDLEMVAEGVETQAQADWLRAQGVQYGQGWLFAKPMRMQDLHQQLDRQQPAV